MRESDLENRVKEYCRIKKMICYKFTSPSHRGVPDRQILRLGKVLFLELKAPGKKPTALQDREITRLQREGFAAGWACDFISAKKLIDDALFGMEDV